MSRHHYLMSRFIIWNEDVQSIWIKAGFNNSKKILYCHFYREHTSTLGASIQSQKVYLEKFLSQWEAASDFSIGGENAEVHIMGDMNLDALNGKWYDPVYHLFSLAKMVHATSSLTGFNQLVETPTRYQYNSVNNQTSVSCIDHVYTNRKFRCSKVLTSSFGNSDHDLISYTRFSKDPPTPARTIRRRCYRNFIEEHFLAELKLTDWSPVFVCSDVEQAVEIFTSLFRTVLDRHAPWILYQQRHKFTPWVTQETIELIKMRNKAKCMAAEISRTGSDASKAWAKFKCLRNKVNNKLKFEERNYKQQQFTTGLGSPSMCWNTARKFINWKTSSGSPSQLIVNGRLITKASYIAEEMNNYFITKVAKIRAGIQYLPNTFEKCKEIMGNRRCKADLNHVPISRVTQILKGLKSSKSTGIDSLDSYSIKISADIVDKPLHHIVCLSIMQFKFPTQWKLSKVIPLHKKDSKLEQKNYRPVSILSPLSKILERVVYDQLYNYFDKNRIFNENLHGFRRNRSTQTALLTMYDRWTRAAAKGFINGVVLIDLSAAFDLVDHDLLLKKLKIYGVQNELLLWIESYLTGRYQSVWIDHTFSGFKACKIGVPQGSILGPLFFLIFSNDLPASLQSNIDSYADDTTITASGKSVEEVEQLLQNDCSSISRWMKSNSLKLNADKTHLITIGTQRKLFSLDRPFEVHMDGILLETTKSEALLGCIIQGNMKWHGQVNALTKKLQKRLNALSQLRYCCPYPLLKSLSEGIFGSILAYCLPVYGGLDKSQLHDIQVLQTKAARIVCNAPPRAKRSEMFKKLGWMTVNQLVAFHSLVLIQKIRITKEPEYLSRYLTLDNRNGRIIVPNQMLTICMKSFCLRGPVQWNLLPQDLRLESRLNLFKKRVQNWIFENISQFVE